MKVPVATPDITPEDVAYVAKCVESGWVSGISPYVSEFEEKFAEWNGSKHAVATGSGTTALHLALASLGMEPGDEVIMPSLTMIATANACRYLGLKPVFCEVERDTWCIDVEDAAMRVTERTRAIMPVHLYGHPCDMGALADLSFDKDLYIVEDCAEAHGATWKKKKVGSFGDVGCYSFYANKIMTTGEGGIITTDDFDLAERMKWLRAHAFGRDGKHYWHEEVGYGYRMGGMQAALGTSQLERLDYYVQKRQLNAWYYKSLLNPLKDAGLIDFPVQLENCENVYWMFSVILQEGIDRADVIKSLAEEGIETRTFFYPLHKMPVYETPDIFPVTDDLSKRGMNLPSGNQLTNPQIEYVCEKFKEAL
jgi:perosamine synthetase